MIVTEQKPFSEILDSLKNYQNLFLIGCGDCATACKTGSQEQLEQIKQQLEKEGKNVLGFCVPDASCVAAKLKKELAKHMALLRQAQALLIFACGLGVQSVKDNDRLGQAVLPGCNTICAAIMDNQGNFYEKCSLCNDCILEATAAICPITLCSKGLLNGPCGGMDKGKCEVDKEKDCAWVLIYKELEKNGKLQNLKKMQPPKDFKKTVKPHKLILNNK
jgi:hypothetical protein